MPNCYWSADCLDTGPYCWLLNTLPPNIYPQASSPYHIYCIVCEPMAVHQLSGVFKEIMRYCVRILVDVELYQVLPSARYTAATCTCSLIISFEAPHGPACFRVLETAAGVLQNNHNNQQWITHIMHIIFLQQV